MPTRAALSSTLLMRQFRERWQAIAAIEAEELRRTTVPQRWQQLNAILRLAISLGLPLAGPGDEESVRRRWGRLKGYRT